MYDYLRFLLANNAFVRLHVRVGLRGRRKANMDIYKPTFHGQLGTAMIGFSDSGTALGQFCDPLKSAFGLT